MKKILIVDDEPDVLKFLNMRLASVGYEVIEALNGPEAIEKAKYERPNLIVLDMMMPGMDGGEVASALSGDEATRDIPVIFLTCLFTKQEEEKGQLIRGNLFVAKPYDPGKLLELIRKTIA